MTGYASADPSPLPPRSGGAGSGVGGLSAGSAAWANAARPPPPTPPRHAQGRVGRGAQELAMTMLNGMPRHPPLPRVTHQGNKTVDAVHELSVGHGDEQRKHQA